MEVRGLAPSTDVLQLTVMAPPPHQSHYHAGRTATGGSPASPPPYLSTHSVTAQRPFALTIVGFSVELSERVVLPILPAPSNDALICTKLPLQLRLF